MIAATAIFALALATLVYCGTKSVQDFRARRWIPAIAGAAIAVLAPAVFGLMAYGLARFIWAGGL